MMSRNLIADYLKYIMDSFSRQYVDMENVLNLFFPLIKYAQCVPGKGVKRVLSNFD